VARAHACLAALAFGCTQGTTSLRIEVAVETAHPIVSLATHISIDGVLTSETMVQEPRLPGAVEILLPDRAARVAVQLVATDAQSCSYQATGSQDVVPHQEAGLSLTLTGQCGVTQPDAGPPQPDAGPPPPDLVQVDFSFPPDMECNASQVAYCQGAGCTACKPGGFCSGGYCDGNGCAAQDTMNCAAFGCGCVNGGCSGGACQGSGCTTTEVHNCALMGCDCADGKCSGGACMGNGCTYLETKDCGAYGCGCAFHHCHGGACP
jgi:hypothetical protein